MQNAAVFGVFTVTLRRSRQKARHRRSTQTINYNDVFYKDYVPNPKAAIVGMS